MKNIILYLAIILLSSSCYKDQLEEFDTVKYCSDAYIEIMKVDTKIKEYQSDLAYTQGAAASQLKNSIAEETTKIKSMITEYKKKCSDDQFQIFKKY